jgi:indolepyruvate ferredoxin oxidoreductase
LAAHAPEALRAEQPPTQVDPADQTLEQLLAQRVRLLSDYQSPRYAKCYQQWVRSIEQQVAARCIPGAEKLVLQVARTLARLMTYKDEYEVARLHASPEFWERLRGQFSGKFKVKFHLAPPMLPGRDASGRPRKREFGAWVLPVFRVLQHGKVLRGTPLDPFGYTHERRQERQLVADYQQLVARTLEQLTSQNLEAAIALVAAADDIRGYGPVKEKAFTDYQRRCQQLTAKLSEQPSSSAQIRVVEIHE